MGDVPPSAPRLPLAALLGRVQGRYVAEFEQRLADAGYPDLSLAHGANVLRHLGTDDAVRLSALVARAGVSKQAVSQQAVSQQAVSPVGPVVLSGPTAPHSRPAASWRSAFATIASRSHGASPGATAS